MVEIILVKKNIPKKFSNIISKMVQDYSDPYYFKLWQKNFYKEALEVLSSKDKMLIEQYLKNGRVPFSVVVETIEKRSLRIGYSDRTDKWTSITTLGDVAIFKEHLKSGKLLYDKVFQNESHGPLVHAFNGDYLSHLLARSGTPSYEVKEFFEFLGGDDAEIWEMWVQFFDAFNTSSLRDPTVFNDILEMGMEVRP